MQQIRHPDDGRGSRAATGNSTNSVIRQSTLASTPSMTLAPELGSIDDDLGQYLADNLHPSLNAVVPPPAAAAAAGVANDAATERDLDQLFDFVNSMGEPSRAGPSQAQQQPQFSQSPQSQSQSQSQSHTPESTTSSTPIIQIERSATLEMLQEQVRQQQTQHPHSQIPAYQQMRTPGGNTRRVHPPPPPPLARVPPTSSASTPQSLGSVSVTSSIDMSSGMLMPGAPDQFFGLQPKQPQVTLSPTSASTFVVSPADAQPYGPGRDTDALFQQQLQQVQQQQRLPPSQQLPMQQLSPQQLSPQQLSPQQLSPQQLHHHQQYLTHQQSHHQQQQQQQQFAQQQGFPPQPQPLVESFGEAPPPQIGVSTGTNELEPMLSHPLTESNLRRQSDLLHSPANSTGSHHSGNYIQDPERVAQNTPSLFSSRSSSVRGGSSNNDNNDDNNVLSTGPMIMVDQGSAASSQSNGEAGGLIASNGNGNGNGVNTMPSPSAPQMLSVPAGPATASSTSSASSSVVTPHELSETYSYLSVPQDTLHETMRQERQRRRYSSSSRSTSRSSSRSRNSSNSYEETTDSDGNITYKLSRARLSDLATPAPNGRKSQKSPSVYACTICDKKFTRPYNLKSHLRTHTNERPYICSVCGKAFARQHDRKRHEDLHTGEKRFQCLGTLQNGSTWGCGKRFARTDALRRHFQTESGRECIRPLLQEMDHERETEYDPVMAAMQNAQEHVL